MKFNEKIAKITPPEKVGLASNPNFVTFESKIDTTEDKRVEATIMMLSHTEDQTTNFERSNISILLKEIASGKEHTLFGSYKSNDLNDKTVLVLSGSIV